MSVDCVNNVSEHATAFVAGLELWYYAQFHWFSGNFRLQALGVVLLVYWILGALFRMRDRVGEPSPDERGCHQRVERGGILARRKFEA